MLVHIVELSTAVVKVDIKVINASLTQNQCLRCVTIIKIWPFSLSVTMSTERHSLNDVHDLWIGQQTLNVRILAQTTPTDSM